MSLGVTLISHLHRSFLNLHWTTQRLIENVDVRKSSPLLSLMLSLETVLIITFLESTAT